MNMITVSVPCLQYSFGLPECTQTAWVYWLLQARFATSQGGTENTLHKQVKLPASVLVTQHLTDQRASSPKRCRMPSRNTLSSLTGSQESSECIHLLLWGIIEYPLPPQPLSPCLCLIAQDSWLIVEWPCTYTPGETPEKRCAPPQFRGVLGACDHPSPLGCCSLNRLH